MPSVRFPKFFFLFFNGPYAGFIYLELQATTAADLSLPFASSTSACPCNVMACLHFSGTFPALPVALCMGPLVLLQVYSNRLHMVKDMQEP